MYISFNEIITRSVYKRVCCGIFFSLRLDQFHCKFDILLTAKAHKMHVMKTVEIYLAGEIRFKFL